VWKVNVESPKKVVMRGGVILLVVSILLILTGCGNDFEDAPVSLERADHGWLVSIEPDEVFDVGLVGNALFPDQRWRLVEVDDTVVALENQEHEKLRQDIEDLTGDERATITMFFFRGLEIGDTPLRFELENDEGDVIAITEFTMAVVEDSCAADDGLVANRCGGSAVDQPQGLTELDHGWLVALEPGDTIDVTLMGNPQFPDGAWGIAHLDAAVVDVADPALRVADRVPGDWSRAGVASFLSRSTFPVTAIDVGRSRVEFHFEADGETIDIYSVTFDVVDDACAVASNQSTCDN
jgi:hypothetical protein